MRKRKRITFLERTRYRFCTGEQSRAAGNCVRGALPLISSNAHPLDRTSNIDFLPLLQRSRQPLTRALVDALNIAIFICRSRSRASRPLSNCVSCWLIEFCYLPPSPQRLRFYAHNRTKHAPITSAPPPARPSPPALPSPTP